MIAKSLDQVCNRSSITADHHQAWNDLVLKGLPSRKDEAWKYTNLQGVYLKNDIQSVYCACPSKAKSYDYTAHLHPEYLNIVLVDGICVFDETALSQNIAMLKFSHDNPMASMAQAMSAYPLDIQIKTTPTKPIFIHVVQTENVAQTIVNYSLSIRMANHVSAVVRYDYHGSSGSVSAVNMLMELTLEDGANLDFDHVQTCGDMSHIVATQNIYANLARNAKLTGFCLSSKACLDRMLFSVNLQGEGAEFDLQGLYLLNHKDAGDYHILANHQASNTRSNVAFRSIANGQSKVTFNAKAKIQLGIKAIQAFQNNRNIQLSQSAEINTKPELEIYADDVACSHGATIGRLDDNALFYLRSRGIPLNQATQLLIESFAKSLLNDVDRAESIMNVYADAIDTAIIYAI